jgi:hypothetical protein
MLYSFSLSPSQLIPVSFLPFVSFRYQAIAMSAGASFSHYLRGYRHLLDIHFGAFGRYLRH